MFQTTNQIWILSMCCAFTVSIPGHPRNHGYESDIYYSLTVFPMYFFPSQWSMVDSSQKSPLKDLPTTGLVDPAALKRQRMGPELKQRRPGTMQPMVLEDSSTCAPTNPMVYIYVCVCTYICIYIYTHTHTHIYIYTCTGKTLYQHHGSHMGNYMGRVHRISSFILLIWGLDTDGIPMGHFQFSQIPDPTAGKFRTQFKKLDFASTSNTI